MGAAIPAVGRAALAWRRRPRSYPWPRGGLCSGLFSSRRTSVAAHALALNHGCLPPACASGPRFPGPGPVGGAGIDIRIFVAECCLVGILALVAGIYAGTGAFLSRRLQSNAHSFLCKADDFISMGRNQLRVPALDALLERSQLF